MTAPAPWPPLAEPVVDRAAERRSDPQWLAESWRRARVVLVSDRMRTPAADGALQLSGPDGLDAADARFLGLVDGEPYFAAPGEPAEGERWPGLRELAPVLHPAQASLVTTAVALAQWHARHGHCPVCGAVTEPEQAGWTRRCPVDGSQHFPRTDPAVIMAVHDGADAVLLGRGPAWAPGRFSTLAGFVEPGESLEGAVIREVAEETSVEVRDVRYVGSQPWPFPASLMVGFSARADRGAVTVDGDEMAEAGWFPREEVGQAAQWTDTGAEPDPGARLRGISPRLSISRYLLDRWLARTLP